jgi:integrative and conjugative element protein (TIGR02256 family)
MFDSATREPRGVITHALVGEHPQEPNAWVLIEGSVLTCMNPFRQARPSAPESGGILLGYRRGDHAHIVAATVPGPFDRGTRTSFLRSERGHREHALTMWRDSEEQMDYMGEWHTHPESEPSPSSTDRRAWNELMGQHPLLPMIFLILGTHTSQWVGWGLTGNVHALRMLPED